MTHVGHPKTFIVEYDLPADSRRKRFYRQIRRYLESRYMDDVGWSTQSVVITGDRKFAFYVYREARAVGGVSHIYEATCIDPDP